MRGKGDQYPQDFERQKKRTIPKFHAILHGQTFYMKIVLTHIIKYKTENDL
jgi:hypothetical protein